MNNNKDNAILVIGAGLIGGSVGLGLKAAGYCSKLGFIDNNQHRIDTAKKIKNIDWVSNNIKQYQEFEPDIIIVATPTLATEQIVKNLLELVNEKIIITDVASTKLKLAAINAKNYIPGHPIAGREHCGINAADPYLFNDANIILTPNSNCSEYCKNIIADMWASLGGKVIFMSAKYHDRLFAYTSHLPHLIAYTLIHCLSKIDIRDDIFKYAAGGLNDFTRTAASDPTMWRDICITNKAELVSAITNYESSLKHLKNQILNSNEDEIFKIFFDAKNIKTTHHLS